MAQDAPLVERGIIGPDAAFAIRLDRVHGRVRAAKEFKRAVRIYVSHRDADARADLQGTSSDLERQGELRQCLLGKFGCSGRGIRSFDQQSKLVSAHPDKHALQRPDGFEDVADARDQVISKLVAVHVIDDLEPIKVDEDDGQRVRAKT